MYIKPDTFYFSRKYAHVLLQYNLVDILITYIDNITLAFIAIFEVFNHTELIRFLLPSVICLGFPFWFGSYFTLIF